MIFLYRIENFTFLDMIYMLGLFRKYYILSVVLQTRTHLSNWNMTEVWNTKASYSVTSSAVNEIDCDSYSSLLWYLLWLLLLQTEIVYITSKLSWQ